MQNKHMNLNYRGQKINLKNDLICLTDFWKAVGRPKNRSAPQWLELPQTINFIIKLQSKIGDAQTTIEKCDASGTYAHWQIALAYAKYLSTDLEMHMNEIYMRYQAGDITLADQIADQANPQAQEWLLQRIAKKLKKVLTVHPSRKRIEE
ncbi:MAG: KilA-N domain-containing protein [Desulfobacterales bacterium]|nr:MAG: KilA-N domain-containing protein [Desulfobacterales bacterium]